ncbi:MAG: transglycosylase family protein [Thermoleophilaceae bacterium]|nr:transglycosylase family protein [Thermoleophilaceae bacterium]
MRKLLVPMLIAIVVLVPAASAAVGPLPVASSDDEKKLATPGTRPLEARAEIRGEAHKQSREALRRAKRKARPPVPKVVVPPHLEAIAQCESGGDPSAIGGGGAYRGKYQFSYSTWAAVGGSGDPAAAPEAEQDRRAAMLYARSGPGQWPVCGS